MDCGSSKIEEGLQAHCKNQPSVHGQLAGISKLQSSKTRDPFLQIGGAERSRQCGACRIRRQALLPAREGIKTHAPKLAELGASTQTSSHVGSLSAYPHLFR
jgi:hypothetical protein